jgi:hypothetical protein
MNNAKKIVDDLVMALYAFIAGNEIQDMSLRKISFEIAEKKATIAIANAEKNFDKLTNQDLEKENKELREQIEKHNQFLSLL